MGYKHCARCGTVYPPGEQQRTVYCLSCRRAYRQARKAADPEAVREADRRYNRARKALPPDAVCRECGGGPVVTQDRLCRACRNAYMTRWRARDPERIRQYNRDTHRRLRQEVLAHYGHRCACCGEARYEFLSLDHSNGGGASDRKRASAERKHLWRWVKHHGLPDGFRVLCNNCNMALGLYGSCPHQEVAP